MIIFGKNRTSHLQKLSLVSNTWLCQALLLIMKAKDIYFQMLMVATVSSLRVCLFRGEIEWMENFREKMGIKTFLECVWLSGKKGK